MRDPITALERAIQSLPAATRAAMLQGIRQNPIVCGAYTDGRGGICPMLAAHRHGGRVTLLAFARSWDAFTARQARAHAPRARELRTLEDLLVASLRAARSDFAQAIAEHLASKTRRDVPGDPRAAAQRVAPIRSTSRSRCSGENGLVRNRSAPAS